MISAGKTCSKCKRLLPASFEYFYRQKATSDGLTSWCRECDREKSREDKRRRRALGLVPKVTPEKSSQYYQTYRAKNLAKMLERQREAERKRRESPQYRVTQSISRRIRRTISGSFKGKFDALGYTPEQLKTHLEKQFTKGMSWDNYGKDWHIDHIIPVSKFNYETVECDEFKKCWCLSNLRPLWATENLSKKDRILFLI